MAGSGYRVPPSLVRRADGQTIQLTPLLYPIIARDRRCRTPAEVAAAVSASTGRTVSEDNVRQLVDQKLRPRAWWPSPTAASLSSRSEPAAGLALPACRHRSRPDPAAHRSRSGSCSGPGWWCPFWLLSRSCAGGCRFAKGWPPRLTTLRTPRAADPGLCGDRDFSGFSRVWSRCGGEIRRRDARRHGFRALSRLARLLHRRHRLLPPRPPRTICAPTSAVSTSTRSSRWRSPACGCCCGTTRSCSSSPRRSFRCSVSSRHWCGSTATTCWPTSPASRTSTAASSRRWSACCRGGGAIPQASQLKWWARIVVTAWVIVVIPLLFGISSWRSSPCPVCSARRGRLGKQQTYWPQH